VKEKQGGVTYVTIVKTKFRKFAYEFTDGESMQGALLPFMRVCARAATSSCSHPVVPPSGILISGRWKVVFEKLYVISVSIVFLPPSPFTLLARSDFFALFKVAR